MAAIDSPAFLPGWPTSSWLRRILGRFPRSQRLKPTSRSGSRSFSLPIILIARRWRARSRWWSGLPKPARESISACRRRNLIVCRGSVEVEGPPITLNVSILQPPLDWAIGTWMMEPGKFRACNLPAAEYTLSAVGGGVTGSTTVKVVNQDVTEIALRSAGMQKIAIETAWEGDPAARRSGLQGNGRLRRERKR